MCKAMTEYKKYKGSEASFQKAIASYLDFKGVLWFHPPNEIKAKPQYMAKRKQQGVKSGVPDICILEPNSKYYGLFIELKVGYNKLSKNQENWIDKLGVRAYKTAVSYSLDETRAIIDEYLKIK
jgi:hypothetical protein